jgi:hypothetical protein
MSNESDYNGLVATLRGIDARKVLTPPVPVPQFTQEAEALIAWIAPDRVALESVGIPSALLDGLPSRVGALRQGESHWNALRFTKEEAQRTFAEVSEGAFGLLDAIRRHMRFAFRDRPDLLDRLCPRPCSLSVSEKIQALNNMAVLGKENQAPLTAAGFDMALLDEAAAASDELSRLMGEALGERIAGNAAKDMRDRAYTYLKEAVDEVRTAGRFLFWRDENRLRGYRAVFKTRRNVKGQVEEIMEELEESGADADTSTEL